MIRLKTLRVKTAFRGHGEKIADNCMCAAMLRHSISEIRIMATMREWLSIQPAEDSGLFGIVTEVAPG